MALRRLLPAHKVDYIRVSSRDWASSVDEGFETIDMRGSLLDLVARVITTILGDVPKTLKIGESLSGRRKEEPILPNRVIREAVVNSLMHRSYQVHQPVQILRYPNRIEIRNPGYSLKPREHFDEPTSKQRNPQIASILLDTRQAETKGTGIGVMRLQMDLHHQF